MELSLTKAQKQYLDTHGPIKADALQKIYRQSVKDQNNTLKKAALLQKAGKTK